MVDHNTDKNIGEIRRRNQVSRQALAVSNDYPSSEDDASIKSQSRQSSPRKSSVKPLRGKIDPESVKISAKDLNTLVGNLSKSKKVRVNKSKFVSKFRDVNLQATASIFDSEDFKKSDWYGCYIIFWLATGYMVFDQLLHAVFESEISPLSWPIVQTFRQDLFKVALTDLAMYLSSYMAYFVHRLCKSGWIKWRPVGWVFSRVYEVGFFFFWLWWVSDYKMGFPWIAKIFFFLHSMVFWMKMYSYTTYNGYLSTVYQELAFSQHYLDELDDLEADDDTTKEDLLQLTKKWGYDHLNNPEETRKALMDSITFCKFELEYQASATVLSNTDETYSEVVDHIKKEIPSPYSFPNNITIKNYFMYSMYPTLVYTLHYPRTPRVRWGFFWGKVCGIFGVIMLMIIIAQYTIYPLVDEAIRAQSLPWKQRVVSFWLIVLDMIPPMLLEYIFVFFLIWDLICNSLGEITRYADREFYGPWWSCNDFGDFARLWNKPVHSFLLRHIYHSSISTFRVNKKVAGLITFLLSSVFHEIAMYVLFDKRRGYLFFFQMLQIPLIMFSQTKLMKNNRALGIAICWLGFMTGPSLIMCMYLVF